VLSRLLILGFGLVFWLHGENDLDTARKLLAQGSAVEAASLLREFVSRNPASANGNLLLGIALSLVPLRSESIAAFNKAIELQPDSATAHHTMGLALGRFGDLGAARESFE
jgi:tetratricopeptide (TPR) repeat protein